MKKEYFSIQPTTMSPRTWNMFSHEGKDFAGGIKLIDTHATMRIAEFYGKDNIVPVLVTEDPAGDFRGWLAKGDLIPEMIYHKKVFEICFAYGSAVEVEKGRGEVIPLKIERTL